MRLLRFLMTLAYGTYLTYAGLLFLFVPWSHLWSEIVVRLPPFPGGALGAPGVRGALSAFGILHFLVAALEIKTVLTESKHG